MFFWVVGFIYKLVLVMIEIIKREFNEIKFSKYMYFVNFIINFNYNICICLGYFELIWMCRWRLFIC